MDTPEEENLKLRQRSLALAAQPETWNQQTTLTPPDVSIRLKHYIFRPKARGLTLPRMEDRAAPGRPQVSSFSGVSATANVLDTTPSQSDRLHAYCRALPSLVSTIRHLTSPDMGAFLRTQNVRLLR